MVDFIHAVVDGYYALNEVGTEPFNGKSNIPADAVLLTGGHQLKGMSGSWAIGDYQALGPVVATVGGFVVALPMYEKCLDKFIELNKMMPADDCPKVSVVNPPKKLYPDV